ncbi:hypothetical protein Anapl_09966 [Anas platyrhynchos]|uniref:Uncharacterized protein n=1 Tax=Anas platyrhynchos TaxID=8839 RepID=R0LNF7_ANAPL|nr:hypothetical protein Anapl_09966 [Anas platyrhynchos]
MGMRNSCASSLTWNSFVLELTAPTRDSLRGCRAPAGRHIAATREFLEEFCERPVFEEEISGENQYVAEEKGWGMELGWAEETGMAKETGTNCKCGNAGSAKSAVSFCSSPPPAAGTAEIFRKTYVKATAVHLQLLVEQKSEENLSVRTDLIQKYTRLMSSSACFAPKNLHAAKHQCNERST